MSDLNDLNNILFEQLNRINKEDISTEDLEKEIKRSDSMCDIAGNIINNANTVMRAYSLYDNRMDMDNKLPKIINSTDD